MQLLAKNDVEKTILDRHSVRAFSSQDISEDDIKDIISKAARAPSGTNTQPWKVYVVQGGIKQQITENVTKAANSIFLGLISKSKFEPPYKYYPDKWFDPYLSRRRKNGWGMYEILGITKESKYEMHLQQLRNFCFFDAPVGIFFTTHKSLEVGAKMAVAMLMQNIMLLAKAQGLDTCPQASWNNFHKIIMPLLNASEDEQLVCGMSLGYAVNSSAINRFYTDREDLESMQFS